MENFLNRNWRWVFWGFTAGQPLVRLLVYGLVSLGLGASIGFGQSVLTVYPPFLTQQDGSHCAFVASVPSGLNPVSYQWSLNGNQITGANGPSYTVANVSPATAGTYSVTVTYSGNSGQSTASAQLIDPPTSFVLSANNLVVVRLGDGAQPLSSATGNTIFLDQISTFGSGITGTPNYINTTMIPDEVPSGVTAPGPALVLPGTVTYDGFITLSSDGSQLDLAGYDQAYPNGGPDVTAGSIFRGIYSINQGGISSLAYTTDSTYTKGGHQIRSVASDGQGDFWMSGQVASADGIKFFNSTYTSYASVGPSSTSGTRVVQLIYNALVHTNTLLYSDSSVPAIYSAGSPPQYPAQGTTVSSANVLLKLPAGSSPNDFAVSPDFQTIYIADDRPYQGLDVQAGGVERWDYDMAAGSYAFSYTLQPIPNNTSGALGLTVSFPSYITAWGQNVYGATIFATTAGASGNSLVEIEDNADPFLFSNIPTFTLYTVSANETLRGVRFGPNPSHLVVVLPGETFTPGVAPGKTGLANAQAIDVLVPVSVYVVDQNYQLLTGATPGTVQLSSSDSSATIFPNGNLNFVGGVATAAVRFQTVGSQELTAADTSGNLASSLSGAYVVQLVLTLPGETFTAGATPGKSGTPLAQMTGTPVSANVYAVDENFFPVVGTGPSTYPAVTLAASDSGATFVPANAELSFVNGVASDTVTFRTEGGLMVTTTEITGGPSASSLVVGALTSGTSVPGGKQAFLPLPSGGVVATFQNGGTQPVSVSLVQYSGNPTGSSGEFGLGPGSELFDIEAPGATAGDTLTVDFFYPQSFYPSPPPLAYYTGNSTPPNCPASLPPGWNLVLETAGDCSTAPQPALTGTAQQGRLWDYTVVFTGTSQPEISQLTGTVFGLGIFAPPVPGTNQLATVENTPASAPVAKLVANASSPNGGTLAITAVNSPSAQGGTVTLSPDNQTITYTPTNNYVGGDSFAYTLSDGFVTAQGTVSIIVTSSNAPSLNTISIAASSGNVSLQFSGIPGQIYVIQSAPSPAGPWTDLSGSLTADPTGLITDMVSAPLPSAQYFRTRVGP